jgi:hypothetical protein
MIYIKQQESKCGNFTISMDTNRLKKIYRIGSTDGIYQATIERKLELSIGCRRQHHQDR